MVTEKFPRDQLSPFSVGQKSGVVLSSSAEVVYQTMFLLKGHIGGDCFTSFSMLSGF